MRLDQYLCINDFFESRNKAAYNIKEGYVYVNNKKILKASFEVSENDKVEVKDTALLYVSKGGLKLEKALSSFEVNVKNLTCLDIGASTGGFTDCLLKHGSKKVYCVDTGTGQLHESLINNPNVVSFEKTNFLTMDLSILDTVDLITIDVSFISIKPIIERIFKCFNNVTIIALIKPQFEIGKIYIKNGVIKDKKMHLSVKNDILNFLNQNKIIHSDFIDSPILGGSGNKEFLIKMQLEDKI